MTDPTTTPETKPRHRRILSIPDEVIEFVSGGKAVFTIKNTTTGKRATYRVEAAGEDDERTYTVLAFTGSDNTKKRSYSLLGVMNADGDWTPRGRLTQMQELEAAAVGANDKWLIGFMNSIRHRRIPLTERQQECLDKNLSRHKIGGYIKCPVKRVAFPWLWDRLTNGGGLPGAIEVWHEGSCCRCARRLTVPASIEMGLGPDCAADTGKGDVWKMLNKLLGRDLDEYGRRLQAGEIEALIAEAKGTAETTDAEAA